MHLINPSSLSIVKFVTFVGSLCSLISNLSADPSVSKLPNHNKHSSYYQQQTYESPVISELKVQETTVPKFPLPQPRDTCPILVGYKTPSSNSQDQSDVCSPSDRQHQSCSSSNQKQSPDSANNNQDNFMIDRYKEDINSWARVHTSKDGRRHFNASIVGVFSCANEQDPSNDLTLDIRLAKPAIDLAIKRAQQSYSKYINFRVSYRSTPDICKHQQAGGHAAEEFFVNGATYFVGPGCTESLSSMGQLASYWRVPMCSTGFLPEIEAYRFKPMTMIQLSLSIQSVGEMFLELFRRYNWHHLVIVTDENHPLHSIIRNGLLDFFNTFERTNSGSTGFSDDLTARPLAGLAAKSSGEPIPMMAPGPQVADFTRDSWKLEQANENWRRKNYRIPQQFQQLNVPPGPTHLYNEPKDGPLDPQVNQQQRTFSLPPVLSVPHIKAQGLIYKERVVTSDNGPPFPSIAREVDYEQTILHASNHSHIMLLLAGNDTVRELLKAAHKHQMSWGQYVFLAHELFGNIKMEPTQSEQAAASDQASSMNGGGGGGQQGEPSESDNYRSGDLSNWSVPNNNSDSITGASNSNSNSNSSTKCAFNLSNFGDKLDINPVPDNPADRQLYREMYSPLMLISLKIPFSNHFGSFIQEVARLSEKEFNHCIDMKNLKSVYSLGVAALVYDCVMLYAYGAAHFIQKTNSSTIDGETLFNWTANRNFSSKLTGDLSVNAAGQRVIDFSLNTFINETLKFEPRAHFIALRKQLEFLPNRSTYWEALSMEPPSSDPHCRLGDPFACKYVDSQSMRDALSSRDRFAFGIWLLVALVLSVALTSSLVGWLIYRRFRIESELLNLWWSIKYEDIIFEDDAEALQDVKRSMSSIAISQDSFAQNSLAPPRQTLASQPGSNQNITLETGDTSGPNATTPSPGAMLDVGTAAMATSASPISNTGNQLGQPAIFPSSGCSSPTNSSKPGDQSTTSNVDGRALCSTSLGRAATVMGGSHDGNSVAYHHTDNKQAHHQVNNPISNALSVSSLTQSVCSNPAQIKQSQNQAGCGQTSAMIGLSNNSIGKFSNSTQIHAHHRTQATKTPTTSISQNSRSHHGQSAALSSGGRGNSMAKYMKQGMKIAQSVGGNSYIKSSGGGGGVGVGNSVGQSGIASGGHQDSGRRRQQTDSFHHKDPSISSQNKNLKLKLGTVLNGGRDQQFTTKVGLYKASRVAAKHLNVKNLNINRQLLIELRQVRDLTHENLIKFIGLCPEEPNVAIVSELCTRGNLQDLLQNDAIRLDWSFRYSIINDIVEGLQHLHSSPIQHHGRLKSSNCVIDNRFVVKLTDFGLPSLLASVELDEQVVNPRHLLWTAPEHLRTKHPLLSGSAKGDIYSLAIIFQEIITRCGPFECEPILCASAQAANVASAAAVAAAGAAVVVAATDTPLVRITPGQQQQHKQPGSSRQHQQPKLYSNSHEQQQQQQQLYQPMVMVQHKQRLEPDEIVNLVRMGLSPPFRPYFRPDLVATSNANQQQASDGFNLCDLIALVQGCWQEQPASRPSISSVKQQIKKTRRGHHLEGSNLMDNLLQRMERYTDNLESLVEQKTAELTEEKKRSEELLYEMLPRFVVDQLRYGHSVTPEAYEAVTIGFSDIKDFTSISAQSSPIEVVNLLNQLYTEFDDCIARYDVYKVETIGDAYMVVSGLPVRNGDQHATEIAEMSLALLDLIRDFEIVHLPEVKLELRIGIHSGPCASGVVGTKMFRYCLFGDTVNTASRMESHGEPMKIHISEDSANILARLGTFIMEPRGQVEIKGKGLMSTYWLLGKRDQLAPDYQAS